MVNTKVTLCGVELDNPVIPASGTYGYGYEFAELYDINLLGTFSFKGTTREPRYGNPTPRIAEYAGGLLNAVGLQNPGVDAVIDKDFGSELLAELLDADMLIILTAVEKVAINYNKPDQKGLDDLTPAEAYKYMEENQFAKGSMLPKVQAAVKFAESKAGRTALITLLEKAKDGIEGKTGTRIHQ